jgi:hypothetical protein
MLVFKNNSLSLETYLVLDFPLLTHLVHINSLNMCWKSNTKILIEMTQWHISLTNTHKDLFPLFYITKVGYYIHGD